MMLLSMAYCHCILDIRMNKHVPAAAYSFSWNNVKYNLSAYPYYTDDYTPEFNLNVASLNKCLNSLYAKKPTNVRSES